MLLIIAPWTCLSSVLGKSWLGLSASEKPWWDSSRTQPMSKNTWVHCLWLITSRNSGWLMAHVVKSVDFTLYPWHSCCPLQELNPIIFLVHRMMQAGIEWDLSLLFRIPLHLDYPAATKSILSRWKWISSFSWKSLLTEWVTQNYLCHEFSSLVCELQFPCRFESPFS